MSRSRRLSAPIKRNEYPWRFDAKTKRNETTLACSGNISFLNSFPFTYQTSWRALHRPTWEVVRGAKRIRSMHSTLFKFSDAIKTVQYIVWFIFCLFVCCCVRVWARCREVKVLLFRRVIIQIWSGQIKLKSQKITKCAWKYFRAYKHPLSRRWFHWVRWSSRECGTASSITEPLRVIISLLSLCLVRLTCEKWTSVPQSTRRSVWMWKLGEHNRPIQALVELLTPPIHSFGRFERRKDDIGIVKTCFGTSDGRDKYPPPVGAELFERISEVSLCLTVTETPKNKMSFRAESFAIRLSLRIKFDLRVSQDYFDDFIYLLFDRWSCQFTCVYFEYFSIARFIPNRSNTQLRIQSKLKKKSIKFSSCSDMRLQISHVHPKYNYFTAFTNWSLLKVFQQTERTDDDRCVNFRLPHFSILFAANSTDRLKSNHRWVSFYIC